MSGCYLFKTVSLGRLGVVRQGRKAVLFLVGFGTRYADGCTSGHAIMGLSLLNLGSLIATAGFFVGGLVVSNLLVPLILGLE